MQFPNLLNIIYWSFTFPKSYRRKSNFLSVSVNQVQNYENKL